MKPGDIVRHEPTGEEWVIRSTGVDSDGPFVEPAGWPPCRARAGDCDLIEEGKFAHWFTPTDNTE